MLKAEILFEEILFRVILGGNFLHALSARPRCEPFGWRSDMCLAMHQRPHTMEHEYITETKERLILIGLIAPCRIEELDPQIRSPSSSKYWPFPSYTDPSANFVARDPVDRATVSTDKVIIYQDSRP